MIACRVGFAVGEGKFGKVGCSEVGAPKSCLTRLNSVAHLIPGNCLAVESSLIGWVAPSRCGLRCCGWETNPGEI